MQSSRPTQHSPPQLASSSSPDVSTQHRGLPAPGRRQLGSRIALDPNHEPLSRINPSERLSLEFLLNEEKLSANRHAHQEPPLSAQGAYFNPSAGSAASAIASAGPDGLRAQLQLQQIRQYLAASASTYDSHLAQAREPVREPEQSANFSTALPPAESLSNRSAFAPCNRRNSALAGSSGEERFDDEPIRKAQDFDEASGKRRWSFARAAGADEAGNSGRNVADREVSQSYSQNETPRDGTKHSFVFGNEAKSEDIPSAAQLIGKEKSRSGADSGGADSSRKLRRKELNRESAQRSRNKRKSRGQLMEQLIFGLASEMYELRSALATISKVAQSSAPTSVLDDGVFRRLHDVDKLARRADEIPSFADRVVSLGGNQIEAQEILLQCVRLFSSPQSATAQLFEPELKRT